MNADEVLSQTWRAGQPALLLGTSWSALDANGTPRAPPQPTAPFYAPAPASVSMTHPSAVASAVPASAVAVGGSVHRKVAVPPSDAVEALLDLSHSGSSKDGGCNGGGSSLEAQVGAAVNSQPSAMEVHETSGGQQPLLNVMDVCEMSISDSLKEQWSAAMAGADGGSPLLGHSDPSVG